MTDLCVTIHDRDRQAAYGLRLCSTCTRHLTDNITALPRHYENLGRNLATATGHGEPVSGSTGTPLPINTGVVELRSQIQHDLAWWAIYIADQRGINRPDRGDPHTVAAWLSKHIDWIAADQAGAEQCPDVMRELAGKAKALLYPSGSKRLHIGPCTLDDCGGTLYATVRADDDARPSFIYCTACEFSKEPSEWLRFGRTYHATVTT